MNRQHYELIAGESAKFWEIQVRGSTTSTAYGRIGSKGQKTTKKFPTPDEARLAAEKLVKQKLKKGYRASVFPLDLLNKSLTPNRTQILPPRRLGWASCCARCASGVVDTVVRKRTTGAVYWHDQDQEDWESEGVAKLRYCYVGNDYGSSDEDFETQWNEKCRQVGETLVNMLKQNGVRYHWNGDPGQVVTVEGYLPRKRWRGEHFCADDEDE
jgi:predicted DNA-binding WGR domain protein